ncbi:GtrA family protein [uncultured Sphingomonas sp.]|uniref:GtrA family protein n=1 Tax=uncultured Sphingomonas sp. TaxID=158754 RepID=UPI0025F7A89C|nr:GtrA family protein [uncultured Sphingomonas sp.]
MPSLSGRDDPARAHLNEGGQANGDAAPATGLAGSPAAQRLLLILTSRNHPVSQILRFGLMTGMSAAITIGLPVLLHEGAGVAPQHGAAIAFGVAFVVNFISLRRLVFRSGNAATRDLLTFVASSLVFRGAEYVCFLMLLTILHVYYVVALIGVLGLSALAKFFWYRRVMHRTVPAA